MILIWGNTLHAGDWLIIAVLSSWKGHSILPEGAVNGAGVNDIPGDRINPYYIQMSLQFNHSIKESVITRQINRQK